MILIENKAKNLKKYNNQEEQIFMKLSQHCQFDVSQKFCNVRNSAKKYQKIRQIKINYRENIRKKYNRFSSPKNSVKSFKTVESQKEKQIFKGKNKIKDVALDYYGQSQQNLQIRTQIKSQKKGRRSCKQESQIVLTKQKSKFSLPFNQYNDLNEVPIGLKRKKQNQIDFYISRAILMKQKHQKQIAQSTGFSQKQMKRLLKIHGIQKLKLKEDILQWARTIVDFKS